MKLNFVPNFSNKLIQYFPNWPDDWVNKTFHSNKEKSLTADLVRYLEKSGLIVLSFVCVYWIENLSMEGSKAPAHWNLLQLMECMTKYLLIVNHVGICFGSTYEATRRQLVAFLTSLSALQSKNVTWTCADRVCLHVNINELEQITSPLIR